MINPMNPRECDCGSGLLAFMQFDADGIPLVYTCDQCHQKKMSKFRPDIMTVSSRFYGERIDEDC